MHLGHPESDSVFGENTFLVLDQNTTAALVNMYWRDRFLCGHRFWDRGLSICLE